MSFGENLEHIRKGKRVSQAKLGQALGLTQQMISGYEKGTSSPNIEVLAKIADFFNVSTDTLIGHVIKTPQEESLEAQMFRYFEKLNNEDKEKCLIIIRTILEDRST